MNASKEESGHAHPNYLYIYIALLVLLGASILLGKVSNFYLMNTLVFSVAGIKAILVARNFMHLKFEPLTLTIIIIGAVACLVAFFIGVAPDVSWRTGWNLPEH